jgi:hypothetical protein
VDVSGSRAWQVCSAAAPDSRALAGGGEEAVGVKQRRHCGGGGRRQGADGLRELLQRRGKLGACVSVPEEDDRSKTSGGA